MGLLAIILVIVFAVIGIPIGVSLILASLCYLVIDGTVPLIVVVQKVSSAMQSFLLIAVPLFILSGHIMEESGITKRLLKVSKALVGHLPGGLAHINVVVSMMFAGINGSALADTAAIGGMLIPAMKEEGYDAPFSVAVTASSSLIGPIIPPSIPFVVYASLASASIGRMFMGGIVPGLLMGGGMMALIVFYARKRGYPRYQRATAKELLIAATEALPALIMPLIIIGGIIFGLFTATEAASVAVVYGIIMGFVGLRTLKLKRLIELLNKSALTTAAVMYVVGAAGLFGYVLTISGMPAKVTAFLSQISPSATVTFIIMCLLLLVVGMFMSVNAGLILCMPLLVPVAKSFGIDMIQFGVVVVIILNMGLMTPPVCSCLQLASKLGGITLGNGFKASWPFLILLFLICLLLILFPSLTTFLPNLVM